MLWLSENIGWIKDVLSVIFTGAATVIAVLTFRYAKVTIFQPEITKMQTGLLMEVLQKVPQTPAFLMMAADYSGTIRFNLARLALEFGFEISDLDPNEVVQNLEHSVLMNIDKSVTLEDIGATVDDMIMPIEPFAQKGNAKLKSTKNGKIVVRCLTPQAAQFRDMIANYCQNPFMPKRIQEKLLKIGFCIDRNNMNVIFEVLEDLLKEISKKDLTPFKVSCNEFAKRAEHVDDQLALLTKVVREYLRVDDIERRLH